MRYKPGMTREEMDAESDRMAKLVETHRELSHLLAFPPFSTNNEQRQQFTHEFVHAIDDQEDDPYAEVMQKWADEIAEARMYMKRYPNDSEAAKQAAAKIQGG